MFQPFFIENQASLQHDTTLTSTTAQSGVHGDARVWTPAEDNRRKSIGGRPHKRRVGKAGGPDQRDRCRCDTLAQE